jgi:hypothetical protein
MRTLMGEEEGSTALLEVCQPSMEIAIIFQDPLTRQWATEVWERTSELLCHDGSSLRFWRMDDLLHPRVAEEAIQAAAEAAIIMVAMRDAVMPPPSLCIWNEGWLAQRTASEGLLVSMVGIHPRSTHSTPHVDEYFRAIAIRGRLDYLPRKRLLPPDAVSAFDLESIADRAHATTQLLGNILQQGRCTTDHRHWGINE